MLRRKLNLRIDDDDSDDVIKYLAVWQEQQQQLAGFRIRSSTVPSKLANFIK